MTFRPETDSTLRPIRAPEQVNGIKQKPIEGVSLTYTFPKENADVQKLKEAGASAADAK